MAENNFLQGKIAKPLIHFAIPLMLSLVLQALYGGVDLMVVGKFGSTSSVSAVATGSQVMHTLTIVVIGLTTGVTILIGQAIGGKDPQRAGEIVGGQIKLLAFVTLLLTIVAIVFAPQAVSIMNAPPEAFDQTVSYMRICGAGMVFIAAYNGISGIFRGIGNSRSPFLFVSIACVCNILLDILFVKYLHMDSNGAALATVMAQGISVLFSLYYIQKTPLPFTLSMDIFKGKESIKDILRIGSPIALQDFLGSVSFLIITSVVNSLGLVASASVGIAEKLFVFLSLIPIAFMSALSAFVAQNVGAKQYQRGREALKIASAISLCAGVTVFLMTYFRGDLLASIFTSDPLVIEGAAYYLHGCSFEYIFIALTFCLLGYFNGRGKTFFVMAQGLSTSFLVRIPLSIYFSRLENTNLYLISLAVPISALVSLGLCSVYLSYLHRKDVAMGHQ